METTAKWNGDCETIALWDTERKLETKMLFRVLIYELEVFEPEVSGLGSI